jgi:hypothetical protein
MESPAIESARPADPPPRKGWAARLALPGVLVVIALGMASPIFANAYKKRQLAENEQSVVKVIREYREAQNKFHAAHGDYAHALSQLEMSGQPADMDSTKGGSTHGYRFRITAGSTNTDRGFDLLIAPEKYGFTGWHTFFLSGQDIYYADLGFKTDRIVQGITSIPADAVRIGN